MDEEPPEPSVPRDISSKAPTLLPYLLPPSGSQVTALQHLSPGLHYEFRSDLAALDRFSPAPTHTTKSFSPDFKGS
ncbi:hypothetical protein UY3_14134 [Chelonia mydas]|uniref:Uncharacterized protein n=1 Tax=Chelonia mydas TaxID=8469 RepID=M7B9A8_CHEMY|nr:hypothetical protein UY3_14134 [Chelonia mydas]